MSLAEPPVEREQETGAVAEVAEPSRRASTPRRSLLDPAYAVERLTELGATFVDAPWPLDALWRSGAQGDCGLKGTSRSSPGCTTTAVPGGISRHSPGRSTSGSETTTRASSEKCWKRSFSG